MLLAGKVACSGIAFLLVAIGFSGPRSTPLPSGTNAGKEVPGIAHPDNVIRMQQTLQDENRGYAIIRITPLK